MTSHLPTVDELRDALSVAEVAERTGRSTHATRDDIYSGRLPAYRVGGRWRVLPEDLDTFVDRLITPSRGAR